MTPAPIPDYAPLIEQAAELRRDIEAHSARLRGEAPPSEDSHAPGATTTRTSGTDDPGQVIRAALESVRSRRFSAGQDRAQLEASLADDPRFSAEYKREQADNFRDLQAREAESVASLAWRRVEAVEADLAARHAEAERNVDASIDTARVESITRDLEARIALGGSPSGHGEKADRIALAEKIVAEAEASGDPTRARAARHALAQMVVGLASASDQGDTGIRARALRARLRDLEGIERGEADRLEGMRKAVTARKRELEQEIAMLEREVTGAKRGIFTPVTPWEKSIFGRTPPAVVTRNKS